jgi:rubrerythrin
MCIAIILPGRHTARVFSVRDAVQLAIATEQTGAKLYARIAAEFSDIGALKGVFDRLHEDERVHEAQFKNLLEVLPPPCGADLADTAVEEYLKATAVSEFFGQNAFDRMANFTMPEEALQNAFQLEKSTLLFYQALHDVVGPNDVLEEIIKTEKDHVVSLMKLITY